MRSVQNLHEAQRAQWSHSRRLALENSPRRPRKSLALRLSLYALGTKLQNEELPHLHRPIMHPLHAKQIQIPTHRFPNSQKNIHDVLKSSIFGCPKNVIKRNQILKISDRPPPL